MRIPLITNWIEQRKMRELALASLLHADIHTHEKLNELVKMARRRELMVVSAQTFAEKFNDKEMADAVSKHFCADQLAALVDLLRMTGYHHAAKWWADANADYQDWEPDEDQDRADAEHELYLETGNPLVSLI